MNRLFKQPAILGRVVNLDERDFKVVKEPLKWVCEADPQGPRQAPGAGEQRPQSDLTSESHLD